MNWEITENQSILNQIREQKRNIMFHQDKIKMEKIYIIKNQAKITKLEQKLENLKK